MYPSLTVSKDLFLSSLLLLLVVVVVVVCVCGTHMSYVHCCGMCVEVSGQLAGVSSHLVRVSSLCIILLCVGATVYIFCGQGSPV